MLIFRKIDNSAVKYFTQVVSYHFLRESQASSFSPEGILLREFPFMGHLHGRPALGCQDQAVSFDDRAGDVNMFIHESRTRKRPFLSTPVKWKNFHWAGEDSRRTIPVKHLPKRQEPLRCCLTGQAKESEFCLPGRKTGRQKASPGSKDHSFPFQSSCTSKIDQQPDPHFCCFQIIE